MSPSLRIADTSAHRASTYALVDGLKVRARGTVERDLETKRAHDDERKHRLSPTFAGIRPHTPERKRCGKRQLGEEPRPPRRTELRLKMVLYTVLPIVLMNDIFFSVSKASPRGTAEQGKAPVSPFGRTGA